MLVVIEGIDKAGKSTQVNLLKELLSKEFKVGVFSFPDYNTNIGREIRAFLDRKRDYNPRVRCLLLSANRWENKDRLEELIRENDIVLLNRYYHSNIVYALADNIPLEWVEMLDNGLPKEDLTIILDINEEVMSKRLERGDLFEEDRERMRRVSILYKELAVRYNWIVIDGNRSIEEVNKDLIKIIMEHL